MEQQKTCIPGDEIVVPDTKETVSFTYISNMLYYVVLRCQSPVGCLNNNSSSNSNNNNNCKNNSNDGNSSFDLFCPLLDKDISIENVCIVLSH